MGYNSIEPNWLIERTIFSPIAAIKTGLVIGRSYIGQVGSISLIVFFVVATIYLFMSHHRIVDPKIDVKIAAKHNTIMLFLGCVVYFAGIFPYIIVRQVGSAVRSTDVSGRDAILAGFGIGIMTLSFVRLLPVKKTIQNLILLLLIIMGIFHFNNQYLSYQEDWYYQLQFAKALENNDGLLNDDTILCDISNASPVNALRFYSLNGISYAVTGRMDKFFFCGLGDLYYAIEFNQKFLYGYNCNDYNFRDRIIDGVMIIHNMPIDNVRLFKMRWNEIFNAGAFDNAISTLMDIEYIRIDETVSRRIYEAYSNDTLTSESLLEIISDE